jgi:hypothetical protein
MKFWVLLEGNDFSSGGGSEVRSFCCASGEIAWRHAREAWGNRVVDVVSEAECRDLERREDSSNASACAEKSTKPPTSETD